MKLQRMSNDAVSGAGRSQHVLRVGLPTTAKVLDATDTGTRIDRIYVIARLRLQVDAASSTRKLAGTLPDPKLSVGIENFPISGMDRFSLTRESMTMQRLALMQEVPNRAKRDARVAGAEAKVERERAALGLQRLQIRQELSQAWIMAQAVEQRDLVLADLLRENQRLQDGLPARIAGGTRSEEHTFVFQSVRCPSGL
eukprot:gene14028-18570_t